MHYLDFDLKIVDTTLCLGWLAGRWGFMEILELRDNNLVKKEEGKKTTKLVCVGVFGDNAYF